MVFLLEGGGRGKNYQGLFHCVRMFHWEWFLGGRGCRVVTLGVGVVSLEPQSISKLNDDVEWTVIDFVIWQWRNKVRYMGDRFSSLPLCSHIIYWLLTASFLHLHIPYSIFCFCFICCQILKILLKFQGFIFDDLDRKRKFLINVYCYIIFLCISLCCNFSSFAHLFFFLHTLCNNYR